MKYSERFAGKVAVVTGGCSGIGRAIAKRFVADSGKVVVGDVDTASFEALTAELAQKTATASSATSPSVPTSTP